MSHAEGRDQEAEISDKRSEIRDQERFLVSDLFVSDLSSLISASPHLSMFAFPPPGVGR
jgi:hypothetical protein